MEQLNLQVGSGLALSWMNRKGKTMEVLGKSSTLNVPPNTVRRSLSDIMIIKLKYSKFHSFMVGKQNSVSLPPLPLLINNRRGCIFPAESSSGTGRRAHRRTPGPRASETPACAGIMTERRTLLSRKYRAWRLET